MIENKEEQDNVPLKQETKEALIGQMTSQVLAAYVVAYQALGLNKEFATLCMQELGRRRSLGDDFEFEKFISEEMEKIPKPNFSDLGKISASLKDAIAAVDWSAFDAKE